MDFAALTILSHFGKVLINMNSFKGYLLDILHKKKWYSKMFKIETTTSNDARNVGNDFLERDPVFNFINFRRAKQHLSPIDRPTKIRRDFSEREISNKAMYCIYRIIRVLYVSVWFYFFPFIMVSYIYVRPFFFQLFNKF